MQTIAPTAGERRPIFVWDTETTGLSPKKESMVEIAAMELEVTSPKQKQTLLSFSSLMRPKSATKEGPRAAARIHGITNKMLQDAPHFRAAWKGVEEYVKHASQGRGRPILVAHNLPFDLRFLKEELRRVSVDLPPWDFADSLRDVAHVVWPGEKASLQSLVDRLGIVNEEAHRALCDVEATAKVLEKADEVLATKALAEDPSLQSFIRRGDFIYNMILRAAERHRSEVLHLWRDEAVYMETSISDSETASSKPESLKFCNMSLSSAPPEKFRAENRGQVFEARTGSVYHTDSNCPTLAYSSEGRAVSNSSRKHCSICKTMSDGMALPFPSSSGREQNSGVGSAKFASVVSGGLEKVRKHTTFPSKGEGPSGENVDTAVYFTPTGVCFHTDPNCYGLRSAHSATRAKQPLDGHRPCQLCSESRE